MTTGALRLALVSMHSDPFADPGTGDVGGMNVVVKHGALALSALGHEVEVFTRRASESSPDVATYGGVRVHHLRAGPARPATKREQENYVAGFRAALQAEYHAGTQRGRGWQIIHSHHWFSGAAALDLAERAGLLHVQSFHSLAARDHGGWELGERAEGPGRVPAEARLARESDALIAVSRAEASTIIDLGAAADRVRIATPGVDHTVFHRGDPREAPPAPRRRPVILLAARLEPLKGADLAIAMLAEIKEQLRPRLVISGAPTGGFDGYDAHLREKVSDLGLTGDVHFAGPMSRTELARAMRSADVVIIPSHSETYGLVALEAAACGTPVLAARVGGLVDAVEDGVTGVLIDGRDPRAWAKRLTELLSAPDLRADLGRAAHQFARAFTWNRMALTWLDVYTDAGTGARALR